MSRSKYRRKLRPALISATRNSGGFAGLVYANA